jgi:hypothetical protein
MAVFSNIFKPGEDDMKQRQLLKLGYIVALVLAVASLINVACDTKKPTSSESQAEGTIAVLDKTTSYTIETIKPELKKLLAYLIRNPQIITPAVLAKAAERHATIRELGLESKFPVEFPLGNGNRFEVYVELFDGSIGKGATIEDAEAYFTLDLDRYPEDAGVTDPDDIKSFNAYVAATEHNRGKGLYTGDESRRQLAIDSTTQIVNYLLFFISGEERLSPENEERQYQVWLNSRPNLSKAQSDTSAVYFWVSFINVSLDNDVGNDEFEMYYSSSGVQNDPFAATTTMIFDGSWHKDATGDYRLFPDINGPGTYILAPPNYIAVEIVDPDSPLGFKLAAIEDDCSTGQHKNHHSGGGFSNQCLLGMYIDNSTPISGYFPFWILDDCTNNDDMYSNSCTQSWGGAPECVWSVPPISHVVIFMRKGTINQALNDWYHVPCP